MKTLNFDGKDDYIEIDDNSILLQELDSFVLSEYIPELDKDKANED